MMSPVAPRHERNLILPDLAANCCTCVPGGFATLPDLSSANRTRVRDRIKPQHCGRHTTYGAIVLALSVHRSGLPVDSVTLYLGRISYSLYLLHPVIIFALTPFYRSVEARGLADADQLRY
jgi:hypothetical protein